MTIDSKSSELKKPHILDKGKLAETSARKATGRFLRESTAGLPKGCHKLDRAMHGMARCWIGS
jgi:hypothetical protein